MNTMENMDSMGNMRSNHENINAKERKLQIFIEHLSRLWAFEMKLQFMELHANGMAVHEFL